MQAFRGKPRAPPHPGLRARAGVSEGLGRFSGLTASGRGATGKRLKRPVQEWLVGTSEALLLDARLFRHIPFCPLPSGPTAEK
jgi:hypothetical protein